MSKGGDASGMDAVEGCSGDAARSTRVLTGERLPKRTICGMLRRVPACGLSAKQGHDDGNDGNECTGCNDRQHNNQPVGDLDAAAV